MAVTREEVDALKREVDHIRLEFALGTSDGHEYGPMATEEEVAHLERQYEAMDDGTLVQVLWSLTMKTETGHPMAGCATHRLATAFRCGWAEVMCRWIPGDALQHAARELGLAEDDDA